MRKLSLFMVVMLVLSVAVIPAFAEDSRQVVLKNTVKSIIEVDNLEFKDMNDNGKLDVYEDWRVDIDTRVADLLSQMTLEEKVGQLFHASTSGVIHLTGEDGVPYTNEDGSIKSEYMVWYMGEEFKVNAFLENVNGTPMELAQSHNMAQEIAEGSRLGIPITFSSDREYNVWGGMIDMPHDAFGTANNAELAEKLWTMYGAEVKSLGYQLVLNPQGVEIGSWYGENPEYLSEMNALEITSMQASGLQTCAKHFITRGGDAGFAVARSVAQTVDNWMVSWEQAIDAGVKWIMLTHETGISNQAGSYYDTATLTYLRETLGYEGVVITDWCPTGYMGLWGVEGIAADGSDLATKGLDVLYAIMLRDGIDQFGSTTMYRGVDKTADFITEQNNNFPDAVILALENDLIDEGTIDRAATRVLRAKFESGLFENPYVDEEVVLSLVASPEYAADPWEITSNAELDAARNPDIVALERKLQAESTVLVKNENNLLPLAEGTDIYVTGNKADIESKDRDALSVYGTVVDTIEDSDVVVIRVSSLDDAAELYIEDAQNAEKKIVLALDCVDPDTSTMESADAILFMNYAVSIDHGVAVQGNDRSTTSATLADMVFGRVQPNGMIVKEIARDVQMDDLQWADLAGDQGATPEVRLMLLATMKTSKNHATPENWSDPLLCYKFGMLYGGTPSFEYDTLILPTSVEKSMETLEFMGMKREVENTALSQTIAVNEPFTLNCLLWNHGDDGVTNVQVFDGDTLIAEKLMAVNGGSWRVFSADITLNTVGEHTIRVGDLESMITVTE